MTREVDQNFWDHLEALRFVLLKILLVFFLLLIPSWFVSDHLISWMLRSWAPAGFKLHYFTLMEPFFVRMKTTGVLALLLTLPAALCWFWSFVSPGLLEREKEKLKLPMISVFFLALCGVACACFFIMPSVIAFSLSFKGPDMTPVIGIDGFVSMFLLCALACALLFQFPVVVASLILSGLVPEGVFRRKRGVVLVVILILAAVFSPPDVLSQILLALPCWILFELTLIFCRFRKQHDPSERVYAETEEENKLES